MEKNLKYYLNLNYPVEIKKIREDEGGGYQAAIPMLGKYAFVGDGETIEEAIADLEATKKYLFEKYLKQGIPIPEPEDDEEKKYSGKFILRIPTELHRYLSMEAKRNNTTLNQYLLYLLTRKSFLNTIDEEITNVSKEIQNMYSTVKETD